MKTFSECRHYDVVPVSIEAGRAICVGCSAQVDYTPNGRRVSEARDVSEQPKAGDTVAVGFGCFRIERVEYGFVYVRSMKDNSLVMYTMDEWAEWCFNVNPTVVIRAL